MHSFVKYHNGIIEENKITHSHKIYAMAVTYAPINVNPHYPPPGQYQGTVGGFEAPGVGDLTNLDSEILGDY